MLSKTLVNGQITRITKKYQHYNVHPPPCLATLVPKMDPFPFSTWKIAFVRSWWWGVALMSWQWWMELAQEISAITCSPLTCLLNDWYLPFILLVNYYLCHVSSFKATALKDQGQVQCIYKWKLWNLQFKGKYKLSTQRAQDESVFDLRKLFQQKYLNLEY